LGPPKVKTVKPTTEIGHDIILRRKKEEGRKREEGSYSLKKQKPQSLLSAVHRAISKWKFDSLPVNRLKPIKIKFATSVKHLVSPSCKS
jgi:hypothetical protein